MSTIQQTLHGYRDGHKLLQASVRISPDASQRLLLASDATGPSARTGFASYLSGFPILSDKLYVLARTWFAPEMSRPGCVWTHSLLVPFSVLDDLDDLSSLLSLHRRPFTNMAEYQETLAIPAATPEITRNQGDDYVLRQIIDALYSGEDKPVVISVSDNLDIEPLIVRVWSQQWPALRRHFSFCTGQLAERPAVGRADMQVIPSERRFRWRDAGVKLLDVGVPQSSTSSLDTTWVDSAVANLWDSRSSLRHHPLYESAPAIRRLFPVLFNLRERQRRTWAQAQAVLEAVASILPEPQLGAEFKRLLLGQADLLNVDDHLLPFVEWASSSRAARAFDVESLQIEEKFQRLWGVDVRSARQLLHEWMRREQAPLLLNLVSAGAIALGWRGLIDLASKESGLLSALVAQNPSVLSESEVWTHGTHMRREALELLINASDRPESETTKVIHAMIVAKAFDAFAEFVQRTTDTSIVSALPAICETIRRTGWEAYSLLHALRSREDVVISWLRSDAAPNSTVSQALALVLEPNRITADRLGSKALERFVDQTIADTQCDPGVASFVPATFVLMCALNHEDSAIVIPAAHAFRLVHKAASERQLDEMSLQWLYRGLPKIDPWREWDLCEKMRVAAAIRLMSHQWEPAVLFALLPFGDDFERLIQTIASQKGGKRFLRSLDGQSFRFHASDEQIRQLRRWT